MVQKQEWKQKPGVGSGTIRQSKREQEQV